MLGPVALVLLDVLIIQAPIRDTEHLFKVGFIVGRHAFTSPKVGSSIEYMAPGVVL